MYATPPTKRCQAGLCELAQNASGPPKLGFRAAPVPRASWASVRPIRGLERGEPGASRTKLHPCVGHAFAPVCTGPERRPPPRTYTKLANDHSPKPVVPPPQIAAWHAACVCASNLPRVWRAEAGRNHLKVGRCRVKLDQLVTTFGRSRPARPGTCELRVCSTARKLGLCSTVASSRIEPCAHVFARAHTR